MDSTIELYSKTFSLGDENDFSLHQILSKDNSYIEIQSMFIMYKNRLITKNYTSTLEFISMLDALTKKNLSSGDENRFFVCRQQKKDNETVRSLQFKYDKQVYIKPFQAMCMSQIFYESKTGLSTKTALISDTVIFLPTNKYPWRENDSYGTFDFKISKMDEFSYNFTAEKMSKMDEYIHNTANLILTLKSMKKHFSES